MSEVNTVEGNKMEIILCAAIHDPETPDMRGNPVIYCGWRHANILWQGTHVPRDPHKQGFLTSMGRFVDRKEAAVIAHRSLQTTTQKKQLFSEDLY